MIARGPCVLLGRRVRAAKGLSTRAGLLLALAATVVGGAFETSAAQKISQQDVRGVEEDRPRGLPPAPTFRPAALPPRPHFLRKPGSRAEDERSPRDNPGTIPPVTNQILGPDRSPVGDLVALSAIVRGMRPGEWAQIPETSIVGSLIPRSRSEAIDPLLWGVEGPRAVITNWTGAAFDGRRLFFTGGGHNSYAGNEIYEFDLRTLAWRRVYDPAPILDDPAKWLNPGVPTPEWGPPAAHTYDGIIWSPKTKSLFSWALAQCWEWRPAIAETNPAAAWVKCPDPDLARGKAYFKTALSPDNGNIILYGGGRTNVTEFDPVAKTYSRAGSFWAAAIWAEYSVADIDPTRRRIYSVNVNARNPHAPGNGVLAIDLDASVLDGATIQGSKPPEGVGNNGCFLFHPPTRQMWWWGGGRDTFLFDPDRATWTHFENPVGPGPNPSRSNGPFSKCAYLPELDVFVGYDDYSEGIWLYRVAR